MVSVYSKDGLEELVRCMHSHHIELYSTGGTHAFIENLGIPVHKVEDLTSYPSILGGRVKTLHPKVFGGILARRETPADLLELESFEIPEIDMVVVDLYPFEETVAGGAQAEDIIEKIDIGGISLIRAAAKNHAHVLIVPHRHLYAQTIQLLNANNGGSTLEERLNFARKAFAISSAYDAAIASWMGASETLRYGENPHQKARFVGDLSRVFDQIQGKELSYNNLLDIDSAWWLIQEFYEPAFAVVKHNNACGLAIRQSLFEAWTEALKADPVSAFGGVLACNRKVDAQTAENINQLFFEVLLAPDFEPEALEILQSKKNRILLRSKSFERPKSHIRTVLNGYLEQDFDLHTESEADFTYPTLLKPNASETADLIMAAKIVKHTRSNAIVLVKNGQLLGSGTGQTSRVDALKQAIHKAQTFGLDLQGAVMASDAFFPFPDCVEIAFQAGIRAVIQPGGSVKDQLSVDFCNSHKMCMVFTGYRHFKH